jgi:hypothetical protein
MTKHRDFEPCGLQLEIDFGAPTQPLGVETDLYNCIGRLLNSPLIQSLPPDRRMDTIMAGLKTPWLRQH